jgi:predicted RNA-binding protein with PIN domain
VPSTRHRDVCLVDGYNVIHKVPSLARLLKSNQDEEAREQLREACLRFSLRRRMRIVLVFDGSSAVRARASRPDTNVEIVYATGARKADGWILDRAERLSNERVPVLVITEDRGIKNALPAKARTMSVSAFWKTIEPKDKDEAGEKVAPPLDDVEAYFLEAERRERERRSKK